MIKIDKFISHKDQMCNLGCHHWAVSRLIFLSKDLPVMNIPLEHLNFYSMYEKVNLREMVEHFKSVQEADLSFPIILDEDGEIMDGRHRIMKALLEEKETIKAVRFVKNPKPCKVDD